MKELISNGGLILIIFILHILFDATADSFKYKYDKTKVAKNLYYNHLFELLQFLVLFCFLLVKTNIFINNEIFTFVLYIFSYAFLRFAIFDVVYNLLTGRNAMYIGQSSFYDLLMRKIFKTPFLKSVLMGVRMIFLIFGLYLIQRILN